MDFLFFDSSAIVKRYVLETGTAWVKSQTTPGPTTVVCLAHISVVEVTSAIVRRQKAGTISSSDAAKALTDFRDDLNKQYFKVAITSKLIEDAVALAEKHFLRAYDAVQLAAVLELEQNRKTHGISALSLISADAELNAAAAAEGIPVDDPNAHP